MGKDIMIVQHAPDPRIRRRERKRIKGISFSVPCSGIIADSIVRHADVLSMQVNSCGSVPLNWMARVLKLNSLCVRQQRYARK